MQEFSNHAIRFSVKMDVHFEVEFDKDGTSVVDYEIEDYEEVLDGAWHGNFKGVYIDGNYHSFNEENVDIEQAINFVKQIIEDENLC